MEHTEIQRRVNELSKAMQSKGLREPSVAMRFECNKDIDVYLRWKDVTKTDNLFSSGAFQFFGGDTPEAAFEKASAFVDSLPSADEARMKQFMGALANAIDLGKDNRIEVEFLNPLQATMKKLTDNILTDQRAA
ncbi:hypothetical protein U8C37_09605 [Sinorhizobium medicae]|uniref:hypothetical protein n=1 Tax=Sinorhizobium medicae TaxID=110321 RepID=UPI002AF6B494|nr:hypothetical protein [Sinorhizobium medicae]WQO87572.1 hypothetical protein U8C37_09605 [Sinorhizobium medicae]